MANRSVISVVVSILLIAQAVQAEPSRACRTFDACVALAERNPSRFSRSLAVSLRGLPAAVLVEGLDWTHPLPAVAARAHLQAEEALRFAGRHSIDSARKLLKHAASRPNDMLMARERCCKVAASSTRGRSAGGCGGEGTPKSERKSERPEREFLGNV